MVAALRIAVMFAFVVLRARRVANGTRDAVCVHSTRSAMRTTNRILANATVSKYSTGGTRGVRSGAKDTPGCIERAWPSSSTLPPPSGASKNLALVLKLRFCASPGSGRRVVAE